MRAPPHGRPLGAVDLFKKLLKNTRLATHGPTLAGLALIPVLPWVDEPIEHAVEFVFDAAWPPPAGGFAASGAGGHGQKKGEKAHKVD